MAKKHGLQFSKSLVTIVGLSNFLQWWWLVSRDSQTASKQKLQKL
jgi:hypothetical protein